MGFSNEGLIFQESIIIDATLPILLVSLIQKIHDHTLGLMIQPFPEVWNISGVMNCVAFLFAGECAMQLYFMALTPPMQQFGLHSQLTATAWGIGSKVTMTGIGLSPSYLTPSKIPLINNWHPSLMKLFGTWWSLSTCNGHSCWM